MGTKPRYRGRCFCCGVWFYANRTSACLCGAACRKRASRTNWGQTQPDGSEFFKPEFRCPMVFNLDRY